MNLQSLLDDEQYDQICIPRLQRDYAQGRNSQKVKDIRHDLLKDIFSGTPLSLNMIFGDVDDKTLPGKRRFIPIDGQQRLTSLFLLHLYGHKMIDDIHVANLDKFCYETRESSNDFVKALISNEWPTPKYGISLGTSIANCQWFVWIWKSDPTVSGMLNMLSDIHEWFIKTGRFPNLSEITFDFQDLREKNLNETLYIKMNSRGLPLTEFEQIKCGFEEQLSKIDFKGTSCYFEQYPFSSEMPTDSPFEFLWRWCMDRGWSEWFWNKSTHTIDKNILGFIVDYTCCFCACWKKTKNNSDLLELIKHLRERFDSATQEVTWHSFRAMFESDSDEKAKKIDKILIKNFFIGLASLFNRIIQRKKELITSWGDSYLFNCPNTSNSDRRSIMLFAISLYKGSDFNSNRFDDWFRFCSNIIQNYDISGEGFISLCRSFGNVYSEHSDNILQWLSLDGLKLANTSEQFKEECVKAGLLLRHVTQIVDAESHILFKGRIRQLLVDANGEYTGIFNSIKWAHFNLYFDIKGCLRSEFYTLFTRAFISCLNKRNQLFEEQYILNHSVDETRLRLTQKRYVKAYHLCLSATKLNDIQPLPWSDGTIGDEFGQYREQILKTGIIESILQYDKKNVDKMRFRLFGSCWFLYPYNNKRPDWYIGLDRNTDGNPAWNRSRNLYTTQLIKDGVILENSPVYGNSNLWWGQTLVFEYNDIRFNWDHNYWIHLLDKNNGYLKRPYTKDESYALNAFGVDYPTLKQRILDLYKNYQEDLVQQK